MRKLVVEFIGTFFLVFTIGGAVASGSTVAPVAIGSALMVMIFAGGHISGAHYNPAVSLAVLIRGRMTGGEMVQYWLAQLAGGLAGAVMSHIVTGSQAAVAMAPAANLAVTQQLLAEVIGTFALAYVVLNVATAKGTAGNSFYGFAIGFTVTSMAIAVGGVSGGAFNPAVGIGRKVADAIVGTGGDISHVWLYIVGPLIGGAVAGAVFTFLNPTDK